MIPKQKYVFFFFILIDYYSRNVLIYFNIETRKIVIRNIMKNMKIGSFLIISQTENLNALGFDELEQIQPSIFKLRNKS